MTTYQITVPYACYNILVNDRETVIHAPPIARWMIGKKLAEIIIWVTKKNGTINNVNV